MLSLRDYPEHRKKAGNKVIVFMELTFQLWETEKLADIFHTKNTMPYVSMKL